MEGGRGGERRKVDYGIKTREERKKRGKEKMKSKEGEKFFFVMPRWAFLLCVSISGQSILTGVIREKSGQKVLLSVRRHHVRHASVWTAASTL